MQAWLASYLCIPIYMQKRQRHVACTDGQAKNMIPLGQNLWSANRNPLKARLYLCSQKSITIHTFANFYLHALLDATSLCFATSFRGDQFTLVHCVQFVSHPWRMSTFTYMARTDAVCISISISWERERRWTITSSCLFTLGLYMLRERTNIAPLAIWLLKILLIIKLEFSWSTAQATFPTHIGYPYTSNYHHPVRRQMPNMQDAKMTTKLDREQHHHTSMGG